MNHQQRIQASLNGQEVDRPPISMWRHFFAEETSMEALAEVTLAFQNTFDWDFMKVNPRASYHVEDWGVEVRYRGHSAPEIVSTPVAAPGDWSKLAALEPTSGVLGDHLRLLEIIADALQGEVPFLMTVFTPASITARLCSSEEVFLRHLRDNEAEVRQGLETVTETFVRFGRACLERGASGLFYATTSWATKDALSVEEYGALCRPYDLRLLESLPPAEFHMLHVCRDHNMLADLLDYPVHAFNWDASGRGNPTLAEGRAMAGGRPVVGGLDHTPAVVSASPAALSSTARKTVATMCKTGPNTGWMLGTGCTFPPETPEESIRAIRQAVESA